MGEASEDVGVAPQRDPGVAASSEDRDNRSSHHRRDIQGLRALAVLFVVAFHADLPIPGGFVGVDVFFVISGFVIAAMLQRELDGGGGVDFVRFYTRRFRRLLPALAVTFTVVALVSLVLLSPLGPLQATARTGIAASLFSANLQLNAVRGHGYFDLASEANALLHTWSLSVEEQFYLVFPALLFVLWRIVPRQRGWTRAVRFVLLAVAMLLSFAMCVALTYRPSTRLHSTFAFYASPTRAWEFGVGVLLAVAIREVRRVPTVVGESLMVVGAATVLWAALAFDGQTTFPGIAALVPVAGTAMLIAGGTVSTGGLVRLLSARPVVWVGDVSYGWYLWHWPLIVMAAAWLPGRAAATTVAALVALVPTAASFRWVERPIRLDDRIVGRRVAALVLACTIVPVVAWITVGAIAGAERRSGAIAAFAEQVRPHADRERGCDNRTPLGERDLPECTWSVEGAKGEAVLVGDSNAGHFTEPVVAAGNALGWDVTVATSHGCPFLDLFRRTSLDPTFDTQPCHDQVQQTVAELVDRRPAVVVIAMSSVEYIEPSSEHLRSPDEPSEASTPAAKAALWERGLVQVLEPLEQAGIPVLVVHPVPQFAEVLGDGWSAETCPAGQIWLGMQCGIERSRADVDRERARAVAAEERAVAEVGGATATLDLADDLCPEGRCSTDRGGVQIYRDATHLSVPGAAGLTDRFERALAELTRG